MSHSSIEVNASTAAFFSAITGMPWPKIREGSCATSGTPTSTSPPRCPNCASRSPRWPRPA
ncbi:hypothetical protein ACFQ2M_38285 [Kitasatospora saccharophila]|uniref:hypothetical protein n=1 Tax=Kitasatospora saccharophila TaxID=407973 RepID=UPI00362F5E6C